MDWKQKLGYYFLGVATATTLSVFYVDHRIKQIEDKYYNAIEDKTKYIQKTINDAAIKMESDLEKKLETEVDYVLEQYNIPIPQRKHDKK